ncbi:MAG: helix-turn-helix transcriptional regulator [Ruminococcaceae bacterium]|nr:helix-turn-helix transcriptional regulator [Oscillospiraceae bacterium]
MNTTLGKRISDLRHKKELKQDELAEMLNVSPQAVSKWENDQTCPDISLLPLLAKILGVSVDELLLGESTEVPVVKIVPENERKDIKDMLLRIVITSSDGDKVRVNLPLGIIEIAIESGFNMTQISGNDSLKNIDLNRIMDMVKQGTIGNILDIESSDGDQIQIFVE